MALDQTVPDPVFDPAAHFGEWLQALESFRKRAQAEWRPTVYLQEGEEDFSETLGLDEQFPDRVCSEGTLVVTAYGKLQADVEVTMAVIDGLFRGKITATDRVVLGNHAVVIGEINTPTLTMRGGAIIEGRCYFEGPEQVEVLPEYVEAPPEQVEILPEHWEPIINGSYYFEASEQVAATPENWEFHGWQAVKGLAKVWRGRIFQ